MVLIGSTAQLVVSSFHAIQVDNHDLYDLMKNVEISLITYEKRHGSLPRNASILWQFMPRRLKEKFSNLRTTLADGSFDIFVYDLQSIRSAKEVSRSRLFASLTLHLLMQVTGGGCLANRRLGLACLSMSGVVPQSFKVSSEGGMTLCRRLGRVS